MQKKLQSWTVIFVSLRVSEKERRQHSLPSQIAHARAFSRRPRRRVRRSRRLRSFARARCIRVRAMHSPDRVAAMSRHMHVAWKWVVRHERRRASGKSQSPSQLHWVLSIRGWALEETVHCECAVTVISSSLKLHLI